MEVPELGQNAAEERASSDKAPEFVPAKTAFLVWVTPEGNTVMSPDINVLLEVERQPSLHEIKGALNNVLDDLNNEETAMKSAQHTVNFQIQAARQMSDARLNDKLLNDIKRKPQGGLAV